MGGLTRYQELYSEIRNTLLASPLSKLERTAFRIDLDTLPSFTESRKR